MSYVYLHEFPDGKYYVGHTEREPEERWQGGHGYDMQIKIADAIRASMIRLLDTVENGYNGKEEKADVSYYELICYKAMYSALEKKYNQCMDLIKLMARNNDNHNIL